MFNEIEKPVFIYCKKCGAPALPLGDKLHRSCDHYGPLFEALKEKEAELLKNKERQDNAGLIRGTMAFVAELFRPLRAIGLK